MVSRPARTHIDPLFGCYAEHVVPTTSPLGPLTQFWRGDSAALAASVTSARDCSVGISPATAHLHAYVSSPLVGDSITTAIV